MTDYEKQKESTDVSVVDNSLLSLADSIATEVYNAKSRLAMNMSAVMVRTYWTVGKYIVEYEQNGSAKAKYGSSMMTQLAKILSMKLGRGYSRPNLNNMRKFYLLYPICQTSDKLTWSHICELITIEQLKICPILIRGSLKEGEMPHGFVRS